MFLKLQNTLENKVLIEFSYGCYRYFSGIYEGCAGSLFTGVQLALDR